METLDGLFAMRKKNLSLHFLGCGRLHHSLGKPYLAFSVRGGWTAKGGLELDFAPIISIIFYTVFSFDCCFRAVSLI